MLHFIIDLDYFKNYFFVFSSLARERACVCDACMRFLFCSLFNDAVSKLRVIHIPCSCLPHPAFISNSCTKQRLRSYMFRLRIVAIIRDPQYKHTIVRR